MKKGLFLLLCMLCLAGTLMAQRPVRRARNAAPKKTAVAKKSAKKSNKKTAKMAPTKADKKAEQNEKVKGAHPYKNEEGKPVATEFAHWSLTPHVGFNIFDGDFPSEMKHSVAIPNGGLSIEYAFTPVWAIGVDYMYDMYNVTGKTGFGYHNADTLLHGNMHKAGAYLSMDLANLFFPRAKKKIVSIQPLIGAGYALYRNTKMYYDDYYVDDHGVTHNPTHRRGETLNYINADGNNGPDYMKDYSGAFYIQGGLNVEFNINRTIALGVRATYNYFVNDLMDGRGAHYNAVGVASKNNDGIADVTLNMRFKLMAVSKTHVRNISSFETWEKSEPIYVHDTVIIQRDSVVIRETATHQAAERVHQKEQQRIYYVYFDNGKSNLDREGLITVQQVADVLKEDSTLYAVVIGYCDNTGSAAINNALGDKRAASVVGELHEEHEINSEHMYAAGMGKLVGRRSRAAYSPNRRAAIRLVDKRTFERMKQVLEGKRTSRVEDDKDAPKVHAVPLTESARPEKVNELKQRASETIMTEKRTTLSKLARKYYNNTYCWVYIYIANKDVIPNPNALVPGTQLRIPELTREEMKITKDESLVLYGNVRQDKK